MSSASVRIRVSSCGQGPHGTTATPSAWLGATRQSAERRGPRRGMRYVREGYMTTPGDGSGQSPPGTPQWRRPYPPSVPGPHWSPPAGTPDPGPWQGPPPGWPGPYAAPAPGAGRPPQPEVPRPEPWQAPLQGWSTQPPRQRPRSSWGSLVVPTWVLAAIWAFLALVELYIAGAIVWGWPPPLSSTGLSDAEVG